eukprot:TRINITY_DN22580_c0_g1_i1.p1 TRINITY_DN22580_c0_g1~~TRINITY_DN22580_c0_g1_i1.p1  ORF type:complete len:631 (+),score=143.69 TRINITY_DN22580_c0_g1_i1:416-2308(+)
MEPAVAQKSIVDVFTGAILKPVSTSIVAVPAMQEAMRPQKQTVLVQDENQLLENGLRTLLEQLVENAVQAEEPVMAHGRDTGEGDDGRGLITRLLDIVLHLCEKGHVEGGMVFQLLEDLTEVSTIKDCKEIFAYIESKQETLGKAELFGRGKLVMLRTCNQLLRRLSKSNDVVFCGRILMFLAHFFPLSERSAVNIKGIFNTSNDTKFEKYPPTDGLHMDFKFYNTFWSLQEHFSNPAALIQHPAKWQSFASGLVVVLDAFETLPLVDNEESSNHLSEGDDATFNIKYLTSSNLMDLELKDPGFRRHILVQCLILFDFLQTPGKSEKESPKEGLRKEVQEHEERVKNLLERTPPKGKEFLAIVEHILERERNWVWWKRDGCPAFERVVSEKNVSIDFNRRRPRWRLGNKELSQLWKWSEHNPNALTDVQRVKVPPVADYWKPFAEDLDPAAGIEPEYSHKKNRVYCWKGLRFAARQDLEGFSRFTEHGIEAVIPPELLPVEVRLKIHGRNQERLKQKGVKKDDDSLQVVSQPEVPGNAKVAVVEDGPSAEDGYEATAMRLDVLAPLVEPNHNLTSSRRLGGEGSESMLICVDSSSHDALNVPASIDNQGAIDPRPSEAKVGGRKRPHSEN